MAGLQCRAEFNTLCIDLDPLLPFGQFLFGTQMLSSFLYWRKWGLWLSVLSSWIAFNSSLWCTYSDLLNVKVLKKFLWFLALSSLKICLYQQSLYNPDTLIKPTNFFVVFMLGWSTVSFSEAIEIKINLSEKVMSLIALIKTKFYAESVILLFVLIILPSLQVKNVWNYREFFTQTLPYLGKYFHALFKNRARQYIYGKLAVLSPCFKPQG